ncbi:hypothetical protein GUJ93_ZPchr0012g19007 [Zizania palustris]|uniref:Uncharacterized protein n=1 Tax=Zizania palustris TaxID=103762 RepID=A0A8J6BRX6_ZIZPA|nr:hypothetical protein GUJ93_ZPchr0012g19007 [Zizania palustris]
MRAATAPKREEKRKRKEKGNGGHRVVPPRHDDLDMDDDLGAFDLDDDDGMEDDDVDYDRLPRPRQGAAAAAVKGGGGLRRREGDIAMVATQSFISTCPASSELI